MNNEPVAWMNPKTLECGYGGDVDWEDTGCIPLYTHPHPDNLGLALSIIDQQKLKIEALKAKTLTDEEIADIISSGEYWTLDEHLNIVSVHFDKFARAILRKAQEK